MGRHADPDPRFFWFSLLAAAGRAVLALAGVVAVFLFASSFGSSPGSPALEGPAPDPTEGLVALSPSPTPTLDPQAPAEPPSEPTPTVAPTPEGQRLTVQVLDAVGDDQLTAEVVSVLEELSYEIVAVSRAARSYVHTTVFYSDGFATQARALRRRDARFGVIEANTRLSPSVNLHVVIGADWRAQAMDESGSTVRTG